MPIKHYNFRDITVTIGGEEVKSFGVDSADGVIEFEPFEDLPAYRGPRAMPAYRGPRAMPAGGSITVGEDVLVRLAATGNFPQFEMFLERSRLRAMQRWAYLYRRGLLPPLERQTWTALGTFDAEITRRARRTAQRLSLGAAAL
jgi:hypothetical protein